MKRALLLATVTIFSCGALLLFGGEKINLFELIDPTSPSHRILFELRGPRLLLVFFVGGSLAVLGSGFQTVFNNPLADPYLLGISSSVALGSALGEVFFKAAPHSPAGIFLALIGGLSSIFILSAFLRTQVGKTQERIVLFGTGMNFVCSSTLFLILSYYHQQLGGGAMRYLFGQVPWLTFSEVVSTIALGTLFLIPLLGLAKKLDILTLGDSVARTLAVNPYQTRSLFLILSSLYMTVLVTATGSIGFVGLVIPHTTRLIFNPRSSRSAFLYSLILGGVFLGISDCVSRTLLPPFEFPIGVVSTLLGGPIFLYLLWKR